MKKTFIGIGSVVALISPIIAFAQTTQCATTGAITLCTVINRIVGYLNQILFLLIGISIVTFAYFVFKYFIQPNENRKEAGSYVMYSVIGFFVILSVWGLVNILQNTFGLNNSTNSATSWTQVKSLFPTQ
jgi:Type IV secretion system pilin